MIGVKKMKKNKRVIIILSVLILGIGVSLAYFVGKMLSEGEGASVKVTTANIKSSELRVEGVISFNIDDMLPGHQELSKIKVIATGENELIPYNLVWKGNNNLNTNLKYYVYKSASNLEVNLKCDKKQERVAGGTMLYEECNINSEDIGSKIKEGVIPSNSENINVELASDEFITSTKDGNEVYYYVVIEYPNEGNQNGDMGKGFKGEVTVEASTIEPDINIVAAYIEDEETGDYKEITEGLPQEGYTINTERSRCSNNAKPIWDLNKKGLFVASLTQSGTECYLYFEKEKTLQEEVISQKVADIGANGIVGTACDPGTNSSNHSSGDCNDTQFGIAGVYSVIGENNKLSYVYRGSVNNNWVKFGKDKDDKDIWWRIIRVNEDGSIRLIYNGVFESWQTPLTTGVNEKNGIWSSGSYTYTKVSDFNGSFDRENRYVGFMYGNNSNNYESTHNNEISSTIKTELETWYKSTKLNKELDKIDGNAGFCNDREIGIGIDGYTGGGYSSLNTAYAPWARLYQNKGWKSVQMPTFECKNKLRDLFTMPNDAGVGNQKLSVPVGLITSDEVIYAGGFGGEINYGFWLCTGGDYWTMSPYNLNTFVEMFKVWYDGYVGYRNVGTSIYIRPVINLKSNIKFTLSDFTNLDIGTIDNPYVVVE